MTLGPSFLQSSSWERFQSALGRTTIRKQSDTYDYFGVIEHGTLNTRLYIPYGPLCKNHSLPALFADIKNTAKKQNVDFVRIEPRGDITPDILIKHGYRKSHDLQPSHTVINDLSGSIDGITANCSQSVRRMWRKNITAGVTFHLSYDPKDISIFIDMIHDVAQRTGMHPHPDSYFQTIARTLFKEQSAGLYYATLDGQPIASILFFSDGVTMSYGHAASYAAHRRLSPATALGLEILLHAANTGHRYFDFYGIAPEGASSDHPWYGFTQFKKSFGGDVVSHLGTWELPLHPLRYHLYRLYQSLRRKLR